MPRPRPLVSKAAQIRQAENTLRGLLRTPKTRPGLIAAVVKDKISPHYVYGWLAERRRDGTLAIHKSGGVLMYQIALEVVLEKPTESLYPSWLDPRLLPTATGRVVVVDGVVVTNSREKS